MQTCQSYKKKQIYNHREKMLPQFLVTNRTSTFCGLFSVWKGKWRNGYCMHMSNFIISKLANPFLR